MIRELLPWLGTMASPADSGTVNQSMEAFADGAPLTLAQYTKAADPVTVSLTPPGLAAGHRQHQPGINVDSMNGIPGFRGIDVSRIGIPH